VYVDLLEHEESLNAVFDLQRLLAEEIAAVLDAPFHTFTAYCESIGVEPSDRSVREQISKAWVSDFERAVRNFPVGCVLILDNYESIEFRRDRDGKRQSFCHAWIIRIIKCLRDSRLTLIFSGRDLQMDTIQELEIPILKQHLSGLDRRALFHVLQSAGVPLSVPLLDAVLESTGGHPLAVHFLLDAWSRPIPPPGLRGITRLTGGISDCSPGVTLHAIRRLGE
jgi:hypothetical protein